MILAWHTVILLLTGKFGRVGKMLVATVSREHGELVSKWSG